MDTLAYYSKNRCEDAWDLITQEDDEHGSNKKEFAVKGVKYLCDKAGKNYLEVIYDKIKGLKKGLNLFILPNDLELRKYFLKNNNKTYPQDLYKNLDSPAQSELAFFLLDLEGIKWIYNEKGENHTQFYDDIHFTKKNITKPIHQILTAIRLNDRYGIEHLLQKATNISIPSSALKLSYQLCHFEIAEDLIKHGVQFDIKYLMRPNPLVDYPTYKHHLENISYYLDGRTYRDANSLIKAMFDLPQKGQVYGIAASLDSAIHTENNLNYSELILRMEESFTVRDVVNFISISNTGIDKVHLLLPVYGKLPFFSPGVLDVPYIDYHIYLPTSHKNFQSALMHEITHAFLYLLFRNGGKPYLSNGEENSSLMCKSYHAAKDNVLMQIIKKVNPKYEHKFNETQTLESILSSNRFILGLNHWFLNQEKIEYITPLFNMLKSGSLKEPNENESLEYKTQTLLTYYNKVANWTKEEAFVIDRMFDYAMRPLDTQSTELLVRIPELYVKGINPTTMRIFNPLLEYWQEFITPRVQNFLNEHFEGCKKSIRNGNVGISCILDIPKEQHSVHPLNDDNLRCKIIDKFILVSSNNKDPYILIQELLFSVARLNQEDCISKLLKFIDMNTIELKHHTQLITLAAENGYIAYIKALYAGKELVPKIPMEVHSISLEKACAKLPSCLQKDSFVKYIPFFCTCEQMQKQATNVKDYLEVIDIISQELQLEVCYHYEPCIYLIP